MIDVPVVIFGAGPAGLTAAYELARRGVRPLVLEKAAKVGGISRTEEYQGYRFDIGGHRFYTKVPEVKALWHEVMGDAMLKVPRLSRIYYDGKFYPYPLDLWRTLYNLGPVESTRIVLSFLEAQVRAGGEEHTFEEWVTNRFGRRLYETFFKTYTEKVWGIPCNEIRADWAAQRIRGLSLTRAVSHALFRTGDTTTLIEEFEYPALGPGQMWERFRDEVEAMGGMVRTEAEVVTVHRDGARITGVDVMENGRSYRASAGHYLNSIPLSHLAQRLAPAVPAHVLEAASGLRYRDFLVVTLIVDREDMFPDNWIYVHSSEVKVGRIQNFKNWSPHMVPDPSRTCLGMEYFCSAGDETWDLPDNELLKLAAEELASLGLAERERITGGTVIRERHTYPVYDSEYRAHLDVLRQFVDGLENLQTIGRAGMHRYNNQDHSMLTAMLAVRNLFGEKHDLWRVNVERSYLEDYELHERDAAQQAVARQTA